MESVYRVSSFLLLFNSFIHILLWCLIILFYYFCLIHHLFLSPYQFSSLIIATRYHPLPIFKEALHLLYPSSPFVVYCEFMEPLVECYLYVTDKGLGLRVSLSDTWMREFQVFKNMILYIHGNFYSVIL